MVTLEYTVEVNNKNRDSIQIISFFAMTIYIRRY